MRRGIACSTTSCCSARHPLLLPLLLLLSCNLQQAGEILTCCWAGQAGATKGCGLVQHASRWQVCGGCSRCHLCSCSSCSTTWCLLHTLRAPASLRCSGTAVGLWPRQAAGLPLQCLWPHGPGHRAVDLPHSAPPSQGCWGCWRCCWRSCSCCCHCCCHCCCRNCWLHQMSWLHSLPWTQLLRLWPLQ